MLADFYVIIMYAAQRIAIRRSWKVLTGGGRPGRCGDLQHEPFARVVPGQHAFRVAPRAPTLPAAPLDHRVIVELVIPNHVMEGAPTDASGEPSSGQSEKAEQLARICELARRLGYNDAKAKMLIGQSVDNLAALERKLLTELDEQPDKMRRLHCNSSDSTKEPREQTAQKTAVLVTDSPQPSRQANSELVHGFLF